MSGFEAFARMESDNWSRATLAADYARLFALAADRTVPPLLEAVAAQGGRLALDVCCGQGNVTEALAASGARACGLDFSPAMLDIARSRVPGTAFALGDAQDLPFPDGVFDIVVSGFGVCHVPDQPRALAEAHRVLRSGGRFAMTVWCGPDRSACFEILYGAIRAHGDPQVALPPGPDFHQFADRDGAAGLLMTAGFDEIGFRIVDCHWELEHPEALCELFEKATARASVLLAAQPAGCLEAIRAAMAEAVRSRFRHGSRYRVPVPAALIGGRKRQTASGR